MAGGEAVGKDRFIDVGWIKRAGGDTGDRMTQTPRSGTAALYGSSSATPEISYVIQKGDDIGFRDDRNGDAGDVVGVAGDNEFPIQAGTVFDRTYYWKIQDED